MLCDKLECVYWLLFRPGLALEHRELLAGALRRARTKSSKGDDDDDAIPMGFGVGHPSFKAAFPESASWDK